MDTQIQLFTLQLREQLAGLREVAVQGRWDGPAPASLPRATIATRLLVGSSELLGIAGLAGWLQVLLELLTWISDHPDGSLACYEPVLREVVAFEEQIIDRIDAGDELRSLVTAERVDALRRHFAGAERAWSAAQSATASPAESAGPTPAAPGSTGAGALSVAGLDDLHAILGAERFLAMIERLIGRVPHPREGEGEELRVRWRAVRALVDTLFELEGEAGAPGALAAAGSGADLAEALPELPGGELFREAVAAGCREGFEAVGQDPGAWGGDQPHWTIRWRVPQSGPAGSSSGAEVDALFDPEDQRRYGRLLGLLAADLCLVVGPKAPPWLIVVGLDPDRVQVEFRRPSGRIATEAARSLSRLLEQEFLLEMPNLRAALRRLKKDGALVDAQFGARGEGRLQVVLPARLAGGTEVCALPLGEARVAVPLHLLAAVLPLEGWQRLAEPDGEVLVKGEARLLLADLSQWVPELAPVEVGSGWAHVAQLGWVEKRVGVLVSGPGRRLPVCGHAPTPAGWEAVAAGGVELEQGPPLPLLDIERLIALRLRQEATAADGCGEAPARSAHAAPAASAGRIILLVASRFRAGDLEEKLAQGHYDVVSCLEPEQVRARLEEGPAVAVVCDNTEPTRCLQGLMDLLASAGQAASCPVVLVTGNDGEAVRRHARRLGADGLWAPPFLLDDLRAQLARPRSALSH